MPAPSRNDPFRNFSFLVEIDGNAIPFKEANGLGAEAEVIEFREGGGGDTSSRKLPGRVRYPNVTLRRGLTTSPFLWDWWKTVRDGPVHRRNVSIMLLDDAGHEKLRWLLESAWIARIEFSDLDAKGNDVAIESVELAHEGLDLVY